MIPAPGGDELLVKVCGLTREEDVRVAIDAGADLLGLVSYAPSPRHLKDASVVTLAKAVRSGGARSVLVVVDADRGAIDALVRDAGLDLVQLCGREDPKHWRGAPYPIFRRLAVDDSAAREVAAWSTVAQAFVLDHPLTPGGSGRGVDPDRAAELARGAPCLLAGGLDGERLAAGLPAPLDAAPLLGFDASSRLEVAPGQKDPDAVRRFVQAARSLGRTHSRENR